MLSVRRAICEAGGGGRSYQISIHALREEGDRVRKSCIRQRGAISIHALREEGDEQAVQLAVWRVPISIHALREEGDILVALWMMRTVYFYPRPP